MVPTKEELISGWYQSYQAGTFLIPKHDPSNVTGIYTQPRSILSAELHHKLGDFLGSGLFAIKVYEDGSYPKNSGFYEVVPSGTSPFQVAGSGVAPGTTAVYATGSYDTLVVVWGEKSNWHCHAENSAWIQSQIGTRLTPSGIL